jgi:integrase
MGHVQDRWWKAVKDPVTGKTTKVRTELYGTGLRYKVRYLDPEGREKSRSYPDRQKRAADEFLIKMEGDKRQGTYIDPNAGKITFGEYAAKWLASQTFDVSTRGSVGSRLNAQILPHFAKRELGSLLPTDVRSWIRSMQDRNVASSYQAVCYAHLSAILSAAVDDKIIRDNPCHARTVTRPRPAARKVVLWPRVKVTAMREALPDRYSIFVVVGAGCGLRQGKIFGLSPDDIDRQRKVLRVVRQVRTVEGRRVFSLPKRSKTREVPLPASVLRELDRHSERFPPVPVTLPWRTPTGEPTTVPLLFTTERGAAFFRKRFNDSVWAPARKAAGITAPTREDGSHALRHHYASVLLDAGESVKALSEYLGHQDAGFTLRTYTHLMPASDARTRKAIDELFGE